MTELLYMQEFDIETCTAKVVAVAKTEAGKGVIRVTYEVEGIMAA